jgi:hypothetical protein
MKIESGIPIPQRHGAIAAIVRQMKVGDSVALASTEKANSFRTAAARAGVKITVRKLQDGTFRGWRKE